MTQVNKQTKKPLTFKSPLVIVILTALAILTLAGAVVTLTSPEHIIGTPTAKPTPTPSPTTAPTPTPTPAPVTPTAINLSSNVSGVFYIGDTARLTAQLNQPTAGITVSLYNNGEFLADAVTDSTGKAVFDRAPINPFDYHVTATIP